MRGKPQILSRRAFQESCTPSSQIKRGQEGRGEPGTGTRPLRTGSRL